MMKMIYIYKYLNLYLSIYVMSLEESITALTAIYNRYSDANLHEKILDCITNELPEILDTFINRIERIKGLEKGADAFINEFLINSDIKYTYIAKSNIFIEYDGIQFKLVNESEILHRILTGITKNKALLPWKYKIKNMIVKKIKETNMFHTIPESHTIQKVLSHLTPLLLQTKEEAKYFLSVIGDNILKKSQERIHLLDIKVKDFIKALDDNLFSYFKNKYHIDTTFKYAWYEHPYENCRIINFNPAVSNINCWNTFIKYHILDIVAVAVHYSNRFENSDKYAMAFAVDGTASNIMYLQKNKESDIIQNFIADSLLLVNDDTATITSKEIQYLWKRFLIERRLPSIIFLSQLTDKLSKVLTYNPHSEVYTGITSKSLGSSEILRNFWKDFMIEENDEEIEIADLYSIYKDWLNNNSKDHSSPVSELGFIAILEHFYDIVLIDNKYIKNYKCLLWDKKQEIITILEDLKITYKFSPECFEKSMDIIYTDYCNRCKTKFAYRVSNKQEFEKYIRKIIPDKFIIRKRILNDYWMT